MISWKSKGVYPSELKPLCTACLHSTKLSGCKLGIKSDKDLLAIEKNYAAKILNA